MEETLKELKEYLEEMRQFNQVQVLLYWDMRTQTPKEGFEGNSDALTYFSTKSFEMSVSPRLGEMLEELNRPNVYEKLDDTWKFIVRRMKKSYDEDRRVPTDFYEQFVREQAESERAWEEAKQASDFSIFAPHLKQMIEMTKKLTNYRKPGMDVYDALLDDYEKGMDRATISAIFDDLKKELVPFLKEILAKEGPENEKVFRRCDVESQKKVQELLLNYIGFDFDKGTTGESEHPFTLNFSSKDVRVTNHFRENNALDAMFSAIHEGGHAIFEMNVNPEYDGTVAGSCEYMGIHESQSRFYENILGRNINFWKPVLGRIRALLPAFSDMTEEEWEKAVNYVKNGMIRTESDEVTYCLHIILRFEMEQAIFCDNVPVEELPAMWNRKMREYLGICPANDAEGILQDMHWSDGSFGYFPSYLLGSIYDGMYLETMEEELGSVDELLARGEIGTVTKWLNEKIHYYGSTREPKEVLANVCHREISSEPLMNYFRKKYSKIYSL